jgi:hypothetical protein
MRLDAGKIAPAEITLATSALFFSSIIITAAADAEFGELDEGHGHPGVAETLPDSGPRCSVALDQKDIGSCTGALFSRHSQQCCSES